MIRLFTGLEIPAAVADDLALLRGGLPGARWIDAENYHLTLRFIGDIDDTLAHEVASLLRQVRRPGFELRLDGLTSFGGRRPRAVVAAAAPSAPLMELQAEHERLMRRAGLEPEGRKYTPHVTLARVKYASADEVARVLQRIGAFRSKPFIVSRFVLFSAKPKTGGGPYGIEEAFNLRGGEYANDLDLDYGW